MGAAGERLVEVIGDEVDPGSHDEADEQVNAVEILPDQTS